MQKTKYTYTREEVKKALARATECEVQHDGWTCGTCFFALSKTLTNQDWQALLLFRGDYAENELDNLPPDIDHSIKLVMALCSHE